MSRVSSRKGKLTSTLDGIKPTIKVRQYLLALASAGFHNLRQEPNFEEWKLVATESITTYARLRHEIETREVDVELFRMWETDVEALRKGTLDRHETAKEDGTWIEKIDCWDSVDGAKEFWLLETAWGNGFGLDKEVGPEVNPNEMQLDEVAEELEPDEMKEEGTVLCAVAWTG
jgi:hypothetical protein